MSRFVIGVDPHKASNTLVVIDERERVVAQQRFAARQLALAMSGQCRSWHYRSAPRAWTTAPDLHFPQPDDLVKGASVVHPS